ncbi:MAG: MFS transporter [Nitrospirae bacterium]|nr:MFS transporter [Nitrospirota bacterium]
MNNQKNAAIQFIILLGIVSLFGDITYEAARSVTGPYLAVLGASAVIVGLVSGLGEFLGYALRLASGYVADRTRAYWPITIIGYALILSIPLLAFAGYWHAAAILIIIERIGKAIRTPARDAMLSHATAKIGRGLGFAIHEAIDQIGAIIGPLIFSAVFLFKGGYKEGFTILWIPALLTLVFLIMARIKIPSPERFETSVKETMHSTETGKKLPEIFWYYAIFVFFGVAGFANFQLIAYHLKVQGIVSDIQIPIFYAIAMGVDAVVALIIGKTYDKIGFTSLITIPLLTLPIPFLAFSHNYSFAVISIVLWGAVMGIHETIMRAAIADIVPIERRGTAYGIFNTIYGASWFIGSVLIGFMYEISINFIFLFVVLMQIISGFVFFMLRGKNKPQIQR